MRQRSSFHNRPRPASRLLAAAVLLSVLFLAPEPALVIKPSEDQIKAVFLFNLIHFVTWPQRDGNREESFGIGIVGDGDFADIVAEAVKGETKDGAPIEVHAYEEIEEVDPGRDRILFIGANHSQDWYRHRDLLAGRPVLVVGSSSDFSRQGGMINLVKSGNRLHIEVNLPAVERSQLLVSSKLLSLAKLVP